MGYGRTDCYRADTTCFLHSACISPELVYEPLQISFRWCHLLGRPSHRFGGNFFRDPLVAGLGPGHQLTRLRQRVLYFVYLFPRATCRICPSPAFSADDRCDLLNQFVGTDAGIFWCRRNQIDSTIGGGDKKNWSADFWPQRVSDRLQQVTIRIWNFGRTETLFRI